MKNRDLILIGSIAVIIIIVISAWYVTVQSQDNVDQDLAKFQKEQEHRDYCKNWSDQLNKTKGQLQNNTDADPTVYNQDVDKYNRDCVY